MYPFDDRSSPNDEPVFSVPDSFSGSVLPPEGTAQGVLRLGTSDLLVEGRLCGPVATKGRVYVAEGGSIQGPIRASEVWVAEGARVSGTVRALEVRIWGLLKAAVFVLGHLALLDTARVHGAVLTLREATLEVALGAQFTGAVRNVEGSLLMPLSSKRGDGTAGATASMSVRPPTLSLSSQSLREELRTSQSEELPGTQSEEEPTKGSATEASSGDTSPSRTAPPPEGNSKTDTEGDFGFEW